MQQIVSYFWQMCLLRAGPERLPASWFPVALTLSLYLAVAIVDMIVARDDKSAGFVLASVLTGVAIQAAIVMSLLTFKGVGTRFPATMAALLGTNAIIVTMMLPVNGLFLDLEQQTIRLVAQTVFLGAFVWWLTIAGFILHRAAGVSLSMGIAIALLVEMLSLTARFSLFPPASA